VFDLEVFFYQEHFCMLAKDIKDFDGLHVVLCKLFHCETKNVLVRFELYKSMFLRFELLNHAMFSVNFVFA